MATAQQIIDAAIARSSKNTARLADPAELLRMLGLALDKYVMHAAVTAPKTFEEVAFVERDSDTYDTDGWWVIPDNIIVVTLIEDWAIPGTEIPVIPDNERRLWRGIPALTRRSNVLYPSPLSLEAMEEIDTLMILGAIQLERPAELTDEMDGRWPERHDTLLEIELARYMATKDGRADELAGLDIEEKAALALYDSWLAVQMANVVSRHGPVQRRANTATLRRAKEG